MTPNVAKYVIIVVVWASYTCACVYYGFNWAGDSFREAALIQAVQNAEKLRDAVTQTEEKTKALYEDKINALSRRRPLPDKCVLSGEFQMRHDRAVGLSESTTARPVTVEAVAETVEDNYFNCRQNIIWLEECQSICK